MNSLPRTQKRILRYENLAAEVKPRQKYVGVLYQDIHSVLFTTRSQKSELFNEMIQSTEIRLFIGILVWNKVASVCVPICGPVPTSFHGHKLTLQQTSFMEKKKDAFVKRIRLLLGLMTFVQKYCCSKGLCPEASSNRPNLSLALYCLELFHPSIIRSLLHIDQPDLINIWNTTYCKSITFLLTGDLLLKDTRQNYGVCWLKLPNILTMRDFSPDWIIVNKRVLLKWVSSSLIT